MDTYIDNAFLRKAVMEIHKRLKYGRISFAHFICILNDVLWITLRVVENHKYGGVVEVVDARIVAATVRLRRIDGRRLSIQTLAGHAVANENSRKKHAVNMRTGWCRSARLDMTRRRRWT